jgi:hypothetical protein
MPRRTATRNQPEVELEKDNTANEHVEEAQTDRGQAMLELGDLRDLIFLGKLKETVEIGGYSFVISTLSASEQRDIMKDVMSGDAADRILDIKPMAVSYAVETVNEVPLEDLCDDKSIKSKKERRLNVILNMQSILVEKLYQVYDNLVATSSKEVGIEDLKE